MDLLSEMIERFTEKRAIDWLRLKFPSFDTSKAKSFPVDTSKNERDYFASANVIGYVATLPEGKSKPDNKPLVVVVVKMAKGKLMTERTCRSVQFNFAKRVLQTEVNHAAKGLDGLPSQGLFFFVDEDGYFRLSLVTGAIENRRFKVNETKRQSFFVDPSAANNIVRRRLDGKIATFEALKDAFSVEQLTKEFYGKLFDWYTWAMAAETRVNFPNDLEDDTDDRKYNNEAIIRLITRLMFTWFIRQRKLVPDALFDQAALGDILKKFDPNSMEDGNYYRAILQNLFFATFNCPQEGKDKLTRRWINVQTDANGDGTGLTSDYRVTTVYRYKNEFKNPDRFLEMMRKVPFLNCALFDCLDKIQRPIDGGKKLFFDGFSSRPKRQAFVPNGLFFDEEKGIISLFNRYEFTVDENNADDADVALDPELLGKVFENLLGAYNPETKETARNATGSFYTPREIVDYMVEESLKNYLKTKVPAADDKRLEDLFDKAKAADRLPTLFSRKETDELLNAIYSCKILDPACGSGAFPMGILHAMVRLLGRLDPDCLSIREQLLKRYREDKATIDPAETQAEREERLAELEKRLEEGQHYPDYERKLYLIENCIYGVDIQAIATQISKLRFFISLLCDQLKRSFDPEAENYGLLSLPNLEAKFVCANTLISLPEVGALDAAVGNIQELREDLQANRHKIFRARSFRTKEKYKAKDLEIRDAIRQTVIDSLSKPDEDVIACCKEQIAAAEERRKAVAEPKWSEEFLTQADFFDTSKAKVTREDLNKTKRDSIDSEIDGYEATIKAEEAKGSPDNTLVATRYANMVAGWDPYDQNASSKWFDSEWMFNVGTGFDIVIGNPPYGAKVSKSEISYYQANYPVSKTIPGKQKGSTDTFAVFINRGFLETTIGGCLTYIVPMSVTSSDSMCGVHKLLFDHCREIKISSYSNRPRQIFEAAGLRTAIIQFTRTETPNQCLWTSRLMRRRDVDAIDSLINSLEFVDSKSVYCRGRLPKIGNQIELRIIEKLFKNKRLKDYYSNKPGSVFYRAAGGRYWNVITRLPTHTSAEKELRVKFPDLIATCLSSSLFWFYQQAYTDGLNLKIGDLEQFAFPDASSLDSDVIERISELYARYTSDIEHHAHVRQASGNSSYNVNSFKEYKIGYSKKIIDEIDDLIGPLYGLTQEEIDYIKNYEIEFRLSDDDMVKASGMELKDAPKTKLPRRAKKQSAAVDEPHEEEEELE